MPIARIARRVVFVLLVAGAGLFTAWALLALHYAPLLNPPGGDGVAGVLALVTVLALLRLKLRHAALLCLAGPAAVLTWFLALHPSNHRQWQPEYAVLPSVTIDADSVRIAGIRNFA